MVDMNSLEHRLNHRQEDLEAERLKEQRLLDAQRAPMQLGLTIPEAYKQAQKEDEKLQEAQEAWRALNIPLEELFPQLHISQKLALFARSIHSESTTWGNVGVACSINDHGYNAYLEGRKMTAVFDERHGRVLEKFDSGKGKNILSKRKKLNDIIVASVYPRVFKTGNHYDYLLRLTFGYQYWQKQKVPGLIVPLLCYKSIHEGNNISTEFELPISSLHKASHKFEDVLVEAYDATMSINSIKNIV